jgi:hypothetical protein
MSGIGVIKEMFGDKRIRNWGITRLLKRLVPFVTADKFMVCDECDEFIQLDEHGFNYDHNCLDPRMVRSAYGALMARSSTSQLDKTAGTRTLLR